MTTAAIVRQRDKKSQPDNRLNYIAAAVYCVLLCHLFFSWLFFCLLRKNRRLDIKKSQLIRHSQISHLGLLRLSRYCCICSSERHKW